MSRQGADGRGSPSTAARRWQASQPGAGTGQPNCGASDEFGYCVEPNHAMSCGSLATTQIGEELRDAGTMAEIT